MNRTQKTRIRKILNKIRQQQKDNKFTRVYQDEKGRWWTGRPFKAGSRQLTPDQVADLRSDPDNIVFVVIEEDLSERWPYNA